MLKRVVMITLIMGLMLMISCAHQVADARPPKPGPDYVWVPEHRNPSGKLIPGHWKHTAKAVPGKAWVPGHTAANGQWVPGHWKDVPKPPKGGKWVPGHWGKNGKWIPGHWR